MEKKCLFLFQMFQESVNIRQNLYHRVLIGALIVFAQGRSAQSIKAPNALLHHFTFVSSSIYLILDLSSRGGAQAWTYSYSISPNRKWHEARKWCQDNSRDMVLAQNQEEIDFLNNILPFNQKYYWIGIQKQNEGVWTWAGINKTVPEEAQNWAPDEPDGIAGQNCVEIYIKRDTDTAKWNNEKCYKKKGTACYTGKPFLNFVSRTYLLTPVDMSQHLMSLSVCMKLLVHRIPAVRMQTVWRP